MKNNIHYTLQARRDLDAIWDHILLDLQNLPAAEHTVDSILNVIDQLESFAALGTPLSSIAHVNDDYRYLVSGSYMVFYRTDGSDIYIDRVLYGRRDYLRALLADEQADTASPNFPLS